MEKIEVKTDDHDQRISVLVKMADNNKQTKRGSNIVIRGLKPNPEPKFSVINMFKTGLGLHAVEKDIKYTIKLILKK